MPRPNFELFLNLNYLLAFFEILKKGELDINANSVGDGDNALMRASSNSQKKVVEYLLSLSNIDVNAKHATTQASALLVASVQGYEDIVRLLLRRKGIHVNAPNIHGLTAMHYAAWHGYDKIVEQLRNTGVDHTLQDKNGWTPWALAVKYGHKKCADLLEVCFSISSKSLSVFTIFKFYQDLCMLC